MTFTARSTSAQGTGSREERQSRFCRPGRGEAGAVQDWQGYGRVQSVLRRAPSAGHIHSRAKRYAVKLFLAHYQHVAYWHEFGAEPPKPYAIEHMGHADVIKPPDFDQFFPVERQKK